MVSGALIQSLEQLRGLGPEPIIVHDGYRCPEHNREVGGVEHSEHLLGIAADIKIQGLSLQQQYDRAKTVPDFDNGGIGVYPESNFIHVDVRDGKARWAKIKGEYRDISLSGLKL